MKNILLYEGSGLKKAKILKADKNWGLPLNPTLDLLCPRLGCQTSFNLNLSHKLTIKISTFFQLRVFFVVNVALFTFEISTRASH